MSGVRRREFLSAIAVGLLSATAIPTVARARPGVDPQPLTRVPPPSGVLTMLPGQGNQLALTVDDGADTEVVAALTRFIQDTGTRLTFFVNGFRDSWTANAPDLRPLVDAGQIQMGNHTWSHPHLTTLDDNAVRSEIQRNADFLRATYGTTGAPFFRPPFGEHDARIDRIAAELGYPTVTLWSGTVGDSLPISETGLVAAATESFQPQRIILAHANLPTITHCFGRLTDLLRRRNLQPVTLDDVFG